MNGILIYPVGNNPALRFACKYLEDRGFEILTSPAPDATHLLLPVPSFESDGRIQGGGILEHILADLPKSITVVGGNLNHPALTGYAKLDLLQDPFYLYQNAAITADCAIRIAGNKLPIVWEDCRALILGWGRIGKCLAAQLKAMGSYVAVAARKPADQAMATALGYRSCDIGCPESELCRCRIVFNTVPDLILDEGQISLCSPECIKIDLASSRGIAGDDVIIARGLPGKVAPESSGALIAKTFIRMISRKELCP